VAMAGLVSEYNSDYFVLVSNSRFSMFLIKVILHNSRCLVQR